MQALDGIHARLKRAGQHLADLDYKRTAFLGDTDSRAIGEFVPETSEYVFRLRWEPPPLDWGLIVGELVHNLRSALDNLVWALVELGGGIGTTRTQFPIVDEPLRWAKERDRIHGLDADDATTIETLQPFNRAAEAAEHPLILLQWLSNSDKHRTLSTSVVKNDPIAMFPLPDKLPYWAFPADENSGEVQGAMTRGGPFDDDDAVLAAFTLSNPGPHPKMLLRGQLPIDVAFTHSNRSVSLNDLHRVRHEVAEIVGLFKNRF